MRFKQEIKDRLYGGYLGVVTDKIDFEIIKVMLADDKKKVEGLEWPFGAVSAVIAVAPDGAVVALKEEHAESYELVKYQDAVEEDMQPIDTDVNEVAEMPSLSVVKVIPAQIEGCNVKHFKEAVKSYLKRYDGIVVTADNYKELSDVVSKLKKTSVYKGYKRDKIEMRGDRAEISDFPLYLNTVAGGLDCRDQTIGGFSFVVKIYAVPVVEIIG